MAPIAGVFLRGQFRQRTPGRITIRCAPGNRRHNHQRVAVLHRRVRPLERADVLIAHVNVDKAAYGTLLVKEVLFEFGMRVAQRQQGSPAVAAVTSISALPPAKPRNAVGINTVTGMVCHPFTMDSGLKRLRSASSSQDCTSPARPCATDTMT